MLFKNKSQEQDSNQAIIIDNPSKYMTLTYTISLLVIAILSLIVHLLLDSVIEQQSQTGKIVNVSGQQRMLSQRASLFTIEYLTTGSLQAKESAADTVAKMLSNHQFLIAYENKAGKGISRELHNMYFAPPYNVDLMVKSFTADINRVLSSPPPVLQSATTILNADFARMAKNELLSGLHAVVQQYEDESKSKVNELRFAQSIVFMIIIFTILIEALFIFRPMVSKISNFAKRLQYDANFDVLSKVFNRRAYNLLAKRTFDLSVRHQHPLTLILADIDFFKKVNDIHGHAAGDSAISWVAQSLKKMSRETDILARIGGEEFAIVLPETELTAAIQVAEKLRLGIAQSIWQFEGKTIQITLSFGVSTRVQTDTSIEQILARADHALYEAKDAGRNCVKSVS
jgi:diguanylate cyclase (GGDEF)-like protein